MRKTDNNNNTYTRPKRSDNRRFSKSTACGGGLPYTAFRPRACAHVRLDLRLHTRYATRVVQDRRDFVRERIRNFRFFSFFFFFPHPTQTSRRGAPKNSRAHEYEIKAKWKTLARPDRLFSSTFEPTWRAYRSVGRDRVAFRVSCFFISLVHTRTWIIARRSFWSGTALNVTCVTL